MTDWTNKLAGPRMQIDQQFNDRVTNSRFSNQEWGLIMTAVEWRIHEPDDPEAARLEADTSKIEEIIPELDRIKEQMGASGSPMAGGGQSGGGIGDRIRGMFDSLLDNGSAGSDAERLADAEALVQEYARELQRYLEDREQWDDIREAAATER
jgi:hypothetical protein